VGEGAERGGAERASVELLDRLKELTASLLAKEGVIDRQRKELVELRVANSELTSAEEAAEEASRKIEELAKEKQAIKVLKMDLFAEARERDVEMEEIKVTLMQATLEKQDQLQQIELLQHELAKNLRNSQELVSKVVELEDELEKKGISQTQHRSTVASIDAANQLKNEKDAIIKVNNN
jgi:DNA repair exonuclease SbcCD ATPase subunit